MNEWNFRTYNKKSIIKHSSRDIIIFNLWYYHKLFCKQLVSRREYVKRRNTRDITNWIFIHFISFVRLFLFDHNDIATIHFYQEPVSQEQKSFIKGFDYRSSERCCKNCGQSYLGLKSLTDNRRACVGNVSSCHHFLDLSINWKGFDRILFETNHKLWMRMNGHSM